MQSNEDANLINFTEDHIPDLNKWLENSSKIIVPSKETNEIKESNSEQKNNSKDDLKVNQTNSKQELNSKIKYLNLNYDQLNNKKLQILTSLSYLVNEERLSIIICKLKLPFHKNLYNNHFSFYKRSNLSSTNQQAYFKIFEQLELIKQTKYIFVKIYLIDSTTRKRISKKKSSLMLVDGQNCILNNNPYDQSKYIIINELMIFKLPINQLSKITIRLTVLGLSSLNQINNQSELRNKKIKKSLDTLYSFGHVEIGCNSLDKSAFLHYQNLLKNLRNPVCMWHSLDLSKQTKRKSSILI